MSAQTPRHLPSPPHLPTTGWRRAAQIVAWLVIGAMIALVAAAAIVPRVIHAVPLTVLTGSMRPHYPPGDLLIVRPVTSADDVRTGDVITFQPISDDPSLITHRVIGITRNGGKVTELQTKGDANNVADPPIVPEQVQGTLLYSLPKVGFLAQWVGGARGWFVIALAAGLFAYAIYSFGSSVRPRARPEQGEIT